MWVCRAGAIIPESSQCVNIEMNEGIGVVVALKSMGRGRVGTWVKDEAYLVLKTFSEGPIRVGNRGRKRSSMDGNAPPTCGIDLYPSALASCLNAQVQQTPCAEHRSLSQAILKAEYKKCES